jgi:hypothetical protein
MNAKSENWEPQAMDATAERTSSVHELMNEATQWLQYARGVTSLLADLIHEADEVNCQQVSLALEAIAAMNKRSVESVSEAHAQYIWLSVPEPPALL